MKKTLAAALSGALAVTAVTGASATTLVRLDLETMAQQAESAVLAKAVSQTQVENENGLFTVTTFEVTDAIFGDAGETVQVAVPGGIRTVNGIRFAETWAGAPQFFDGQETILLIDDQAGDLESIVGYSQGVFPVVSTAQGKRVLMQGNGRKETIADAKEKIRAAKSNPKGKRAAD